MKLTQLPPPLLVVLTVGVWLTAFSFGNRTWQNMFQGQSAPEDEQAVVSFEQIALPTAVQPSSPPANQENTLFILLGEASNDTLSTVWHIKDMPGSPVFMDLLVPSSRYGTNFDEEVYDYLSRFDPANPDEAALEALFAVHGFSWSRVVVMDLPAFVSTIDALNRAGQGRFTIETAQVLAPLPRKFNDPRSRSEIVAGQIAIWNSLCPLFLSTPAVQAGSAPLFAMHTDYSVCVASDDVN